MQRLIAIIVALLILAGAGWWGWTHPEALPGALSDRLRPDQGPADETAEADAAAPSATVETIPAERPAPPAAGTSGAAALPSAPTQTPAPQDAPLPPETGSAQAIETERVAEAVIAAADARARAEAEARAERDALETARAGILAALAPLLSASDFDPALIRARLDGLAQAADPLVLRQQQALVADITAILTEAEARAAAGPDQASETPVSPGAADGAAPAGADAAHSLSRIRQVLQ